MFAKILAGIVMGVVAASLCAVIFVVSSAAGEYGGKTALGMALASFIAVLLLATTAARSRYAWGRGLLISGLLCFAMALAALAFGGALGPQEVGSQTRDTGAAIVSVMAGTLLTVVATVLGFIFGLIFLAGSYFALRKA